MKRPSVDLYFVYKISYININIFAIRTKVRHSGFMPRFLFCLIFLYCITKMQNKLTHRDSKILFWTLSKMIFAKTIYDWDSRRRDQMSRLNLFLWVNYFWLLCCINFIKHNFLVRTYSTKKIKKTLAFESNPWSNG